VQIFEDFVHIISKPASRGVILGGIFVNYGDSSRQSVVDAKLEM